MRCSHKVSSTIFIMSSGLTPRLPSSRTPSTTSGHKASFCRNATTSEYRQANNPWNVCQANPFDPCHSSTTITNYEAGTGVFVVRFPRRSCWGRTMATHGLSGSPRKFVTIRASSCVGARQDPHRPHTLPQVLRLTVVSHDAHSCRPPARTEPGRGVSITYTPGGVDPPRARSLALYPLSENQHCRVHHGLRWIKSHG